MLRQPVREGKRHNLGGPAGGPDGVRPQHILEMVNCRETSSELHSVLTGFVNCLLKGEIHPSVSLVLFEGNLIALEKKTGGVQGRLSPLKTLEQDPPCCWPLPLLFPPIPIAPPLSFPSGLPLEV